MPFDGTIVISQKPVATWERFSASYDAGQFENLSMSRRADGNYYRLRVRLHGDRVSLSEMLNRGLARDIQAKSGRLGTVWEGFIYEMVLNLGGTEIRVSLQDMCNAVWVRYRVTGSTDTVRSAVAEDADSQARFGRRDFVLTGGELEDSSIADQVAEAWLRLHKWPKPSATRISVGGSRKTDAQPFLDIDARGYMDMLNWRVWNQTAVSGNQGVSAEVTDIIGQPAFDDDPLLEGLVAWWALDEASGSRFDSHGVNTLAVHGTGGVGSAAGKKSNAADFERADSDYLDIADNADLSTGDIDYTLACWIKLESLPSVAASKFPIMNRNVVTEGEYMLKVNDADNCVIFTLLDSGGGTIGSVSATDFGALSAGTWYFVRVWHDSVSNLVGIQINSAAPQTAATSGTPSDRAISTLVGRNTPSGSQYFDGLIDELAFWKRLLLPNEHTQLYNGGSGLAYSEIQQAAEATGIGVIVDATAIDSNPTLVTKKFDQDRFGGDIIRDITRLGDPQFRRWLAYMKDGRVFAFEAATEPVLRV